MKTPKSFRNENSTYQYRNMLATRYASKAMSEVFSEWNRAKIWRQLWIVLAEAEQKLGLPITKEQIQQMKKAALDIDFERIESLEIQLKHDVMSHLKAFAEKAPIAEPIIHLGATSCYITDNADVIILREATSLVIGKLTKIIDLLGQLILKYRNLEMTGFTHFQPAQPVTLGKRMALWAQDLVWDLEDLCAALDRLRPLGCKGTTGTQLSFLVLFQGNEEKVEKLDQSVAEALGFPHSVALSGQTLSRKVDNWFLQALSNLGSTVSKISFDLRLLQHLNEVMESFDQKQVGSSAMPYKQNPMLAERMTGLSRFLLNIGQNGLQTHATQWFERSLDDSSNRRLVLPESFLAADALCEALYRWLSGMRVQKAVIEQHFNEKKKFFQTEVFMMEETLKGKSRQALHEEIRKSMMKGKIRGDKASKYALSGMAARQSEAFVKEVLRPALKNAKIHLPESVTFAAKSI